MITLKTFNGQSISAQNDSIIYQTAVPMNGIIKGCDITLSQSNILHIAAGYGLIRGRLFEIEAEDIQVNFPSLETLAGQLYIKMDLANAENPISLEVETGASLTTLVADPNVNFNLTEFDMQLCTFNISVTEISNLVETYPFIWANNNQVQRNMDYAIGDIVFCQEAPNHIFYCIHAGKTAVTQPANYANLYTHIHGSSTVTDGSCQFKAYCPGNIINDYLYGNNILIGTGSVGISFGSLASDAESAAVTEHISGVPSSTTLIVAIPQSGSYGAVCTSLSVDSTNRRITATARNVTSGAHSTGLVFTLLYFKQIS